MLARYRSRTWANLEGDTRLSTVSERVALEGRAGKDDNGDAVRIAKKKILAAPWPVHWAATSEALLFGYNESINIVDPELETKAIEAMRCVAMIDFEQCIAGCARETKNTASVSGLVPFLHYLQTEQVAVPVARLHE